MSFLTNTNHESLSARTVRVAIRSLTAALALIPAAGFATAAQTPAGQTPASAAPATSPAVAPEVATVILVRHAEKGSDDPTDPSLSTDGKARAEALVAVLDGAGVDAIYSTPYKRTRGTVEPLAKRFQKEVIARPITGINLSAYAQQFAREVLATNAGKTVVIVGHSNTVPDLVKAFTGRTVAPYTEDEYDRFYLVTVPSDGTTASARLFQMRYGKPTAPAASRYAAAPRPLYRGK